MNIKTLAASLALLSCSAHPSQSNIDGIDVSRHQGKISWNVVKEQLDPHAFTYIKCTEGATYVDPNYKENADNAKESGFYVGGYHFFRMTSSAHSQFHNFKKALDKINTTLIPMVDVETGDGASISDVQDSLQVLLNLLEKEYGKKPMIYGTMRSYNTFCAPRFNNYHLYLGRYGETPPIINGKGHYTIWQYSDAKRLRGVSKPIDVCRFHPDYNIDNILL